MKYRDPKTGEVFEDIKDAYSKFCCGRDCDTGCPLNALKACNNWSFNHPAEAARQMGLEVVEESTMGQVNQMEQSTRTRIREVLKVEVGEQFSIGGYPAGYGLVQVCEDGKIRRVISTKEFPFADDGEVGNEIGPNVLYYLLNHPDRIIRKPSFTPEEVGALRILYAAGARWLARGDKHLRWYAKRPYQRAEDGKWDMQGDWGTMSGRLPAKLFPSLRPGQAITLEEIIG